MGLTQHAGLTPERWSRFTRTQQILQIAAEMQRGLQFLRADRMETIREGYERVLRLVDLTIQVQRHSGLRRELLRWRDVIAELYLRDGPDPATHRCALEVLLLLDAEAAEQIPYLGP